MHDDPHMTRSNLIQLHTNLRVSLFHHFVAMCLGMWARHFLFFDVRLGVVTLLHIPTVLDRFMHYGVSTPSIYVFRCLCSDGFCACVLAVFVFRVFACALNCTDSFCSCFVMIFILFLIARMKKALATDLNGDKPMKRIS